MNLIHFTHQKPKKNTLFFLVYFIVLYRMILDVPLAHATAGVRIENKSTKDREYFSATFSPSRCDLPMRGENDCTRTDLWTQDSLTFPGDLRNITLTRETKINITGNGDGSVDLAQSDQVIFKTNGLALISIDTCRIRSSVDYDPVNSYTTLYCQQTATFDQSLQIYPGANVTEFGGQLVLHRIDLKGIYLYLSYNYYFIDKNFSNSTIALYNYSMHISGEVRESFSDGRTNIASIGNAYIDLHGDLTETADIESLGISFDSQQITTDKQVLLHNKSVNEFPLADIYFTIDGTSLVRGYGPYQYSMANTTVSITCDDSDVIPKYTDKCTGPINCKAGTPIGNITAHLTKVTSIDTNCNIIAAIPYE